MTHETPLMTLRRQIRHRQIVTTLSFGIPFAALIGLAALFSAVGAWQGVLMATGLACCWVALPWIIVGGLQALDARARIESLERGEQERASKTENETEGRCRRAVRARGHVPNDAAAL